MKQTQGFFPTLREAPKEAEAKSHILMLRAGLIRQLAAGLYTYLPFGWRALRRVEQIVREEMDRAGGIEVHMPTLQPDELWKKSKRWEAMGPELMRIADRNERQFVLGPTHEEVITSLVANELRSYRDLPKNFYQIQTKFRDEIRPRFGIVRAREFIMKDAYSFDVDEAAAEKSYMAMYDAYSKIFHRCGLRSMPVEADTGVMGGSHSHEFMVPADIGEAEIVSCDQCNYQANRELTESVPPQSEASLDEIAAMEEVHTPGMKTVEDVAKFLKTTPDKMVKTMIYVTEEGPLVVLLRGDHTVNEAKLTNAVGSPVTMAEPEVIEKLTKAPVGFAGPVGLEGVEIWADHYVKTIGAGASGANKGDHHVTNMVQGRDYSVTKWGDFRAVDAGETCPKCNQGKLDITFGIEVGHIFVLGTKYSDAFQSHYTAEDSKRKPMVMGCYGIGVSRTMAAIIEANSDDLGIIWPVSVAPYHVHILNLSLKSEETTRVALELYDKLQQAGLEVLLDDRKERPGIKFKDADLLGMPYRIIVGEKSLKEGNIEFVQRRDLEKSLISPNDCIDKIKQLYQEEMSSLTPSS